MICSAVGIYLVALFACRCLIRFSPQRSVKILGQVSKVSSIIRRPILVMKVVTSDSPPCSSLQFLEQSIWRKDTSER
jgi:hypothetical protein